MIEFRDLNQMFFILSQRAADQYSRTPILHHSSIFLQAQSIDSEHAQRTWFFESNYTRD